MLVGEADDGLDFFGGLRTDCGAGNVLVGVARGIDIHVGIAVLVGCEDPLAADDAGEGVERCLELFFGNVRWKHHGHF